MNTEAIKRVINVSGENVSDVIDSIIETIKSDRALRDKIYASFWIDNFTPEELAANNIVVNGSKDVSSGCWSFFGKSRTVVTGDAHVNMFGRGIAEIKSGTGHIYNTANCRAEGNSSVRAYDYTHMRLHMKAVGEYHDNACGEVYGEADMTATGNTIVRLTGKSTGLARGESMITQTGKTFCKYSEGASGELHGSATAEAWGRAGLKLKNESSANLYDDATAELFNDSRAVTSDRAMVIAKECAYVVSRGRSAAQLYNNCRGEACENSIMTIHDNCFAVAGSSATLELYDKAQASVSGSVAVTLHGDNILNIDSDGIVYHVTRDAKGIVRNNATMELTLHGHSLKVIEK